MLGAYQEAFVALITDAAVRGRFRNSGAGSLSGWDLTPRERDALASIDVEELDRFARTLSAKRFRELSRVVPLTSSISPTLEDVYRGWLEQHPAPATDTVLPPGVSEGLRVLPVLRRALGVEPEACYAPELATWEILSAASRIDREPRVMNCRFAVHRLLPDLRRGLIPIDPDPLRCAYRFDGARVRFREES